MMRKKRNGRICEAISLRMKKKYSATPRSWVSGIWGGPGCVSERFGVNGESGNPKVTRCQMRKVNGIQEKMENGGAKMLYF